MSKVVRPGNWENMLVVLDSIPVECPECRHEVSLRGSINIDKGEFEVTACPHCGAKMEMQILAEGEGEAAEATGLEEIELSIGLKNMPSLNECLYRVTGMKTVWEVLDRTLNILCTVFANQAMNPSTIKDMYVKELLAIFYTADGKRDLVEQLEKQIEVESKGN